MPEQAAHGVVILAAGASRRLGQPKQLLTIGGGEKLVRRATRLALGTQPHTALIVVGAGADDVFAAVADLPIRRVDCPDWQLGMGASLRAGLAALPEEVGGALVVLCDQPALDRDHLDRLVSSWYAAPGSSAASEYAGRIGVPALLPRAWFQELEAEPGDSGARELLSRHRGEVISIRNEALAADIDVSADLGALGEE